MKALSAIVALIPVLALAGSSAHFAVEARYLAAKKKADSAAIAVRFTALDPEVRINEEPAPQLKLDPKQKVLAYKAPSASMVPPSFDPAFAKYLDLSQPVSFAVTLAEGAPKGPQKVAGSVVYFYCSKKEGWCRKGSTPFEVTVD